MFLTVRVRIESCLAYLIAWIIFLACAESKLPNCLVLNSVLVQVAVNLDSHPWVSKLTNFDQAFTPALLIVRASMQKDVQAAEDVLSHVQPTFRTQSIVESVEANVEMDLGRSFNESELQ